MRTNITSRLMRSRSKASRHLAKFFRKMLQAHENTSYDFTSNGEALVLRRLEVIAPQVIFDVGANVGTYTRLAHEHHPAARIFTFEVAPDSFAALREAVPPHDNIVLVNAGLSNTEGTVQLHSPGQRSPRTSFYAVPGKGASTAVAGRTVTGDRYCEENGIERIDFLKIDVEGAEHLVLEGFSRMLAARKIRAIQFEYGYVNVVTHFLLADFYALLTRHGYRVGKLYPQGVYFKDYVPQDENFWGPNYLAVREEEEQLLASLAYAG